MKKKGKRRREKDKITATTASSKSKKIKYLCLQSASSFTFVCFLLSFLIHNDDVNVRASLNFRGYILGHEAASVYQKRKKFFGFYAPLSNKRCYNIDEKKKRDR